MTHDPEKNRVLLEAANERGEWFEARKTQGLWAKRLDDDTTVETKEGPLEAKAGDYLCRGVEGELWPQSEASLEKKYTATDRVDEEGFRYFDVKDTPDTHVMAAPIREGAVSLSTAWGEMTGETGDLLVKRVEEREVALPEDVWIVTKGVFEKTYTTVTHA